jgi:hypothetical protein
VEESDMSGKIKLYGLVLVGVLAGVLAVLTANGSPGVVADDPCGGHYVGEALKAVFSESYTEGDTAYESAIYNDVKDFWYSYAVPDGDCVFYFRNGHVGLTVDRGRNLRYVKMRFDGEPKYPTGDLCAPNPYCFAPGVNEDSWPRRFYFRTSTAYNWFREGGKLILKTALTGIDFPAMVPGDIAYCESLMRFWVLDVFNTPYDESSDEYWSSNEPVKVTCELEGGVVRWVIRPIAETYTIRTETKVKKSVVVNDTTYSNSLWRNFISGIRRSCDHGTFYMPFELIFKRL